MTFIHVKLIYIIAPADKPAEAFQNAHWQAYSIGGYSCPFRALLELAGELFQIVESVIKSPRGCYSFFDNGRILLVI